MAAIGLSEKTKITVLIIRELSIEGLEEIPNSGSCGKS
jgi:hypothetical protein